MGSSIRFAATSVALLAVITVLSARDLQAQEDAFPTCYQVGSGNPGAVTATLQAVVSPTTGTLHGVVKLTQATNPPLNLTIPVNGHYDPNSKTPQLHIAGARPGAQLILLVVLPGGFGKPGKGEFRYYAMNKFGEGAGDATPCKAP